MDTSSHHNQPSNAAAFDETQIDLDALLGIFWEGKRAKLNELQRAQADEFDELEYATAEASTKAGLLACAAACTEGWADALARLAGLEAKASEVVAQMDIYDQDVANLHETVLRLAAALKGIAGLGGNLTDEALEECNGVGDGKSRAIMLVTARQLAREAIGSV